MKKKIDWKIDLLKFIARWDFIDMRFLLLEYSNKHRSYLNIQLKKLEHSKVLKCVHIPIVVNHAGCFVAIYYLTKDGYDLLDSYSEWTKLGHRLVALDHNLTCLRIIKALHIGKYSYWTERQNVELANKFQLSNLHKSITKLYQEAKSVDFIYDKGQGKVAVEVELHIKTLNRYFISKHYQLSVFKRINRDFGKGLFKRLEYWIPQKLVSRFQQILRTSGPGIDQLTCPYEIKVIENLIPGWKVDNRYKFNFRKINNS